MELKKPGRNPSGDTQPDHPFGSLLKEYMQRRGGITQAVIADASTVNPATLNQMIKGTRLIGTASRERVLLIIEALVGLDLLYSVREANALLATIPTMNGLDDRIPAEAALLTKLRQVEKHRAKPGFSEDKSLRAGGHVTDISSTAAKNWTEPDPSPPVESQTPTEPVGWPAPVSASNDQPLKPSLTPLPSPTVPELPIMLPSANLENPPKDSPFIRAVRKPFVLIPVGLVVLGLVVLVVILSRTNSGSPSLIPAQGATATPSISTASPEPGSVTASQTLPGLFVYRDTLKDDNYLKKFVLSVSFSANSKTLASGSANSKINLWRVNANGTLDRTPEKSLTGFQTGTEDRASWVVYSKDGSRLAVASGSRDATGLQKWEIAVWEVDAYGAPKTDQPFQRINPAATDLPAFGFSYDGKLIASPGPNNSVVIWEVDTGKQLITFPSISSLAREFSFSKDGTQLLVAATDGSVKLYSVKDGSLLKTFDSHPKGAWTATISPDQKLVASGGADKAIVVSDIATGEKLAAFNNKYQDNETYSVVFSPNGKILATAGLDGNIVLWNVSTGEKIQELRGGTIINNLAFSPDGRFIASGTDTAVNTTINLWQITDNSKTK